MSFSSRLHNIALGGLLATLLFASALLAQENKSDQKSQTPQPQQTEQQTTPPFPVTVTGPVTVTVEREKAVEPDWKKPSCDAPQNHDEADLCQQIRMSEAAEGSVRLNGYQSGIAVLGALLVIITIVYARRAAIAARDAAETADKTLVATQNNILKQLRAYIWVDRAWITFDRRDAPVAHVYIKNFGQTPAKDVRWWIHIWIERHPLRVILPRPDEDFLMSSTVLPPGGELGHQMPKEPPVALNEVELLGTPQGTIYVYGEVRYFDIEDNERVSEFRMIHGGGEPTGRQHLKPDHDGNRIT